MVNRTVLYGVVVSLLLAAAGCAKSSGNIVADGAEGKVYKIERGPRLSLGGSATATAKQGNDIVRVIFELKASPDVKNLTLKSDEQQLMDADGKGYKANADLSFSFGSGGGAMSMDSVFEVPQNATLKTFKLGRANLDISEMSGAKPNPK